MFNYAICDDNEHDINIIRDIIKQYITESGMDICIESYMKSSELSEKFNLNAYDVLFLDIDMPDINGIELAHMCKNIDKYVNIVFITNREDMVFEAIRYQPFRYIRKSNLTEELKETLVELTKKHYDEMFIYEFKTTEDSVKLKLDDVLYIESKGHELILHTKNGCKTIRARISDYEKKLIPFGFLKIQRSFLINLKYVYLIKRDTVIMDNQETVAITRGKGNEIKKIYMEYIRSSLHGIDL